MLLRIKSPQLYRLSYRPYRGFITAATRSVPAVYLSRNGAHPTAGPEPDASDADWCGVFEPLLRASGTEVLR